MKKKKLKSIKSLHKKAWALMSEYVRLRDKGICVTCGKKDDPKLMHAGHFVHKRSMDFDGRNISCQCPQCNKWKHGNLGIYAIEIDKKHGAGTAEKLIIKGHEVKKFTREELTEIIEDTEKLINRLKFEELSIKKG